MQRTQTTWFTVAMATGVAAVVCFGACTGGGPAVVAVQSGGGGSSSSSSSSGGSSSSGAANSSSGASSFGGISSSTSSGGGSSSANMCTEAPNKPPLPPPPPPIFYGTRAPTYVTLTAEQQNAVVAVGESPSDGNCSGTLIAERVVLTARHCTRGTSGNQFYVMFGPSDQSPALAVRSLRKREHPDVDLALLELESAPAAGVAVAPIPIALEDLGGADVGITLEQAGYGQTESGGGNGRFFVAEPLDGFEEPGSYLVVNGMGIHGVCFGDSGGPSMRVTASGDTRVVGALGWGDDSCVGRDRYTRVDVARAWIEEWTGPTPGTGPQPCGTITAEGRCSATGTLAQWCENDLLSQVACGAGTSCGWDAGVNGWRCIAAAADPCNGVTWYGQCQGEELSFCNRGVLQTRNCGACAERCVLRDNEDGYACAPSDCGNLDYVGQCTGAVAEWCNADGMREAVDCGAQGQSCGYTGAQSGYYCLATACQGADYFGRCNGNTVEWCQNSRFRTRDCASEGKVCAYVSAEIGYFCATP